MQGKMKKIPGPLAPPFWRRPSLNVTALSYSWTTCWSHIKPYKFCHSIAFPTISAFKPLKVCSLKKIWQAYPETEENSNRKCHNQRDNSKSDCDSLNNSALFRTCCIEKFPSIFHFRIFSSWFWRVWKPLLTSSRTVQDFVVVWSPRLVGHRRSAFVTVSLLHFVQRVRCAHYKCSKFNLKTVIIITR